MVRNPGQEAGRELEREREKYRDAFLKAVSTRKNNILKKLTSRLNEALDAEEVKVFCDKGDLITSDPLVAHRIRLDAVKLAGEWLGLRPADKHELTGKNGGPFEGKIEIVLVPGEKP